MAQESAEIFEEETPNKVKKVELEIQSDKEDSSTSTNSDVGKFLFALYCDIRSNPHVFFLRNDYINNYLLCNFYVFLRKGKRE